MQFLIPFNSVDIWHDATMKDMKVHDRRRKCKSDEVDSMVAALLPAFDRLEIVCVHLSQTFLFFQAFDRHIM